MLLAASALSGCFGEPGTQTTGTLTVCVTDQPHLDFSAVFLTFGDVEVQRGGEAVEEDTTASSPATGTETETTGTTATPTTPTGRIRSGGPCVDVKGTFEPLAAMDDENGTTTATGTAQQGAVGEPFGAGVDGGKWTRIESEPRTVNLMEYQGGLKALLGTEDVPTGHYSQLRIQIESGWAIRDFTNETVSVRVPSGELKVQADFDVREDQETILVVDFDLERSLVEAQGQILLQPVVKVVAMTAMEKTTPTSPTTAATNTTAGADTTITVTATTSPTNTTTPP